MKTYRQRADEWTVFVHEYLRLRYGKWETVVSHFRRPPGTAAFIR